MAKSKEIQPADAKRYARTETGGARRPVQAQRTSADARDLGAEAVCERISIGFFDRVNQVLRRFVPLRVLNRGVYARKDAKIVQTPLAFGNLRLRERIAVFDADAFRYDAGLGCVQAVHHHPPNIDSAPGRYKEIQLHLVGSRAGL